MNPYNEGLDRQEKKSPGVPLYDTMNSVSEQRPKLTEWLDNVENQLDHLLDKTERLSNKLTPVLDSANPMDGVDPNCKDTYECMTIERLKTFTRRLRVLNDVVADIDQRLIV